MYCATSVCSNNSYLMVFADWYGPYLDNIWLSNMPRHQSSISLKRLLTKSAGGKHGCGPISRGMTKLGGACLDQSASLAPFSSLSSAVSGRLHFLFIMPYSQSRSPPLSLPAYFPPFLSESYSSCRLPMHPFRGGERRREGWWELIKEKKGKGKEEMGNIIRVCCVRLHKHEFVFVLCVVISGSSAHRVWRRYFRH